MKTITKTNKRGDTVIVSRYFNGHDFKLLWQEKRDGVWSGYKKITTRGDTRDHSVAFNNNGDTIITWTQDNGSDSKVFKSEHMDGAWRGPKRLSFGGFDAFDSNVAVNDDGDAIIAWVQFYKDNCRVYKSTRRNGTWHWPKSIDDYIGVISNDANAPDVEIDNNGDIVISWLSGSEIIKKEYKNKPQPTKRG